MQLYIENSPEREPISLERAQTYLKLDADAAGLDVELVASLITAARSFCERYCDRAFLKQDWRAVLDQPQELRLPGGNNIAIKSFVYQGENDNTQIMPAAVYTASKDGRIKLRKGMRWPKHSDALDCVEIVYSVGDDRIPQDVIHAMRLLMASFYENRSGTVTGTVPKEVTFGVESLLARYRVLGV